MRCTSLAVLLGLWLASPLAAADYLLIVPDFLLLSPGDASAPVGQAGATDHTLPEPDSPWEPSGDRPPGEARGVAVPSAAPCADGSCALPAARPARRGFFRLRR